MQNHHEGAALAPSRSEVFWFWLKLGFISFGGPAGQIAIMHRQLVDDKRWISEARFLHALNYCMLLPGPEAQQLATYLGWLMHRTLGGIVAGLLFVLPSLLLLIGLSWVYVVYGQLPAVAGLLYGIKPAVAALVLQAVHRVGSRTLKKPSQAPVLWAVAVMSFIAIAVFQVAFPWVVLAAALVGWLGQRMVPAQFAVAGGHGSAKPAAQHRGAWLDDHTPTPPHARYRPARLAAVLLVGAALWLLPVGALLLWQGWQGPLTQMAWFFTKAALLTFGGAYAVLPYVYQGAVKQFGWLTGPQMMDGLALGESTPGPLIMVVTFVGFLGGWTTFLPSFVFILAGGPLVESTHGRLQFTAPLTAITAAVVGVIASLAILFIAHIAYSTGPGAGFLINLDAAGLALTALAAWALMRLKWGVMPVIAVCALIGLALKLVVVS